MKINSINSSGLVQNYEKANRVKSGSNPRVDRADSVELSDSAIAFAAAIREARKAEDVESPERSAKIAELTRQVRDGSYRVDSELIAEKMVSGLLFDARA